MSDELWAELDAVKERQDQQEAELDRLRAGLRKIGELAANASNDLTHVRQHVEVLTNGATNRRTGP